MDNVKLEFENKLFTFKEKSYNKRRYVSLRVHPKTNWVMLNTLRRRGIKATVFGYKNLRENPVFKSKLSKMRFNSQYCTKLKFNSKYSTADEIYNYNENIRVIELLFDKPTFLFLRLIGLSTDLRVDHAKFSIMPTDEHGLVSLLITFKFTPPLYLDIDLIDMINFLKSVSSKDAVFLTDKTRLSICFLAPDNSIKSLEGPLSDFAVKSETLFSIPHSLFLRNGILVSANLKIYYLEKTLN